MTGTMTQDDFTLLKTIATEGNQGKKIVYLGAAATAALVAFGFVEVKENMPSPDGTGIGTRITPEGLKYLQLYAPEVVNAPAPQAYPQPTETAVQTQPAPVGNIGQGYAPPAPETAFAAAPTAYAAPVVDNGPQYPSVGQATEAGGLVYGGVAVQEQAQTPSGLKLTKGLPVPTIKTRKSLGASNLPSNLFTVMQKGDSYHIAKTDKEPEPHKRYSSAVSAATKATGKPIEGETRLNRAGKTVPVLKPEKVFTIRRVGAEDPDGVGARIYRVE